MIDPIPEVLLVVASFPDGGVAEGSWVETGVAVGVVLEVGV